MTVAMTRNCCALGLLGFTCVLPILTSPGCLGFTWASSPACTELEIIVMNWLGKMIGLPKEFLQTEDQKLGGGVIQTTASECTLVIALLFVS